MEELYVEIQNAADKIASPNWAAKMSAITALVAVVLAFTAMIVTIIVARKQNRIAEQQNGVAQEQAEISKRQVEITEQQNRIALFEKRYELYIIVNICTNFGHFLNVNPFINKVLFDSFVIAFYGNLIQNKVITEQETTFWMMNLIFKLKQGKFLFVDDVGEYTQKIADSLRDFFQAGYYNMDYELSIDKKNNFLIVVKDFEESGALKKMEKELQMQTNTIWRK